MQVVIALPRPEEIDRLYTSVCGVPLLSRVVASAIRSGGTKVLLVLPSEWSQSHRWLVPQLCSLAIESQCIETIETLTIGHHFDPGKPEDWRAVAHCLDDQFLWMPYDYLADTKALAELLVAAAVHLDSAVRFSGVSDAGPDKRIFERPTVLLKCDQAYGEPGRFQVVPLGERPGISVRPPATVREAEEELVRRSGKVTDGIYSRFNRRLCSGAVRWLSHTPVTANVISIAGLVVAAFAGLCFAQGSWPWDVAGAVLFLVAGLFDGMDGMLARLKIQESAFGCWLETVVDYTTYLLVFAGMTIGGYRRDGEAYLLLGAALLLGSVLSFVVIGMQRRLAAPADRPSEYPQRYLAALDGDARNPISRMVRQLQFFTKKSVLIHYLLLFAVLGLLPLFVILAAFGANVAWMVTIYLNRRLFLPRPSRPLETVSKQPVLMEVEK